MGGKGDDVVQKGPRNPLCVGVVGWKLFGDADRLALAFSVSSRIL